MVTPTPRVASFLGRVRQLVEAGRLQVTDYARSRAWDELEWTEWDIREQVLALTVADHERCERSAVHPDDLVWIFCPDDPDYGALWIRLVERDGVIVVSFHQG